MTRDELERPSHLVGHATELLRCTLSADWTRYSDRWVRGYARALEAPRAYFFCRIIEASL